MLVASHIVLICPWADGLLPIMSVLVLQHYGGRFGIKFRINIVWIKIVKPFIFKIVITF